MVFAWRPNFLPFPFLETRVHCDSSLVWSSASPADILYSGFIQLLPTLLLDG